MQNYCLKHANQVEKTKTKKTYLLIAANFFLLFFLYHLYFLNHYCHFIIDAIFVLMATGQRQIKPDKKRYQ